MICCTLLIRSLPNDKPKRLEPEDPTPVGTQGDADMVQPQLPLPPCIHGHEDEDTRGGNTGASASATQDAAMHDAQPHVSREAKGILAVSKTLACATNVLMRWLLAEACRVFAYLRSPSSLKPSMIKCEGDQRGDPSRIQDALFAWAMSDLLRPLDNVDYKYSFLLPPYRFCAQIHPRGIMHAAAAAKHSAPGVDGWTYDKLHSFLKRLGGHSCMCVWHESNLPS